MTTSLPKILSFMFLTVGLSLMTTPSASASCSVRARWARCR